MTVHKREFYVDMKNHFTRVLFVFVVAAVLYLGVPWDMTYLNPKKFLFKLENSKRFFMHFQHQKTIPTCWSILHCNEAGFL